MKALALTLAIVLTGCTVGPNYQRPKIVPPTVYRGDTNASTSSLGDEKWWAVFDDPVLQRFIHTALAQNYDVRIAATRILQAQARLGITRADQFPTLSGSLGFSAQKIPFGTFAATQLQGALSYDFDFWGRYRRATEAARANLLATQWNQRTVVATLVSSVASTYFQLRELDLELEISQRTLASRRQSLSLTETLANGGATSLLDVKQAQQLVETAAAAVPELQRQIVIGEDALSDLLGQYPSDIPRGKPLTEQPLPASVPVGLPSHLLERRPDIQAAEQDLIAANAQIGVARAQLFPDLALTGTGGGAVIGLSHLTSIYTFSPTLTQQIFNAGRLRSNVRLSEAEEQQQLLIYQQTIQTAFREVSDALVSYQRTRESREHQELLTAAARDASSLSDLRYRGGAASYLEFLTNETNFFSAELNLARARLAERLSLVQLYNSLGGGWEQ
ncbi:MAG TPA: efflux transporter outer membrane subunit [Bryobacteraceae bacterium]